jgi:Lipase (class 3)
MSTISNLPQRQIMLSFAYLAYCGELITTPNPQQTILGYINKGMPQIPPLAAPNDIWAVVWGPAVYTVPGGLYQDNLMFVAQNQIDTTQFAIAIRGTNGIAKLDWLLEDFDVLQQMNWPPGAATPNPAGAMMSESTSIDLQILLAMQGAIAGGGNASLMSFLKSQAANAINLCVTGHSLGGCLAGTLALYLKENQNSWDSTGKSIVSCITFAAPTAGNAAFAAYSDSVFSGGSYPPNWDSTLGANCDAVRCNYDVAPQFWVASNISTDSGGKFSSPLFETYGANLDFASGLSFASGLAWNYIVQNFLPPLAATLSPFGYTRIENTTPQLAGTYNKSFAPASDGLTDYLKAFVEQAAWQHGNSYPTVLGVPALLNSSIIPLTF